MSLDVSFKFTVCQAVKSRFFGNEGVVQTLAYERGGNKYWVKFSNKELDAWLWEDELISIDPPSSGFRK